MLRPLMLLALLCTASAASANGGAQTYRVDTFSALPALHRALDLAYEFEYLPQTQPRIGSRRTYSDAISRPGSHYDEEIYRVTRTHRLTATLDLRERWWLRASLPHVSRSHQHVHHNGQAVPETWKLGDLGDGELLARYTLHGANGAAPAIFILAGLKIPTGRETQINQEFAQLETPAQTGSGSWDGLLGLSLSWAPPIRSFLSATYRFNGPGTYGYRLGDVLQANAGTLLPLASTLSFEAQVNLRIERQDQPGEPEAENRAFEFDASKSGGTYVFLSPGLRVEFPQHCTLSALIQLPVYQWVRRIQLTSPYAVRVSLSRRIALPIK